MKTILVMLFALSVSMGASAQRRGHVYVPRHRVVVVPSISYGFGYSYPYGSPFYSPYYSPFGYPYGPMNPAYNNSSRVPYKLSLEIQSVKSDYRAQIKNVRKDKGLSNSARRQQIRSLKADRDKAVYEAARNFNSHPLRNQEKSKGSSNNQTQDNDNSSFQDNGNS